MPTITVNTGDLHPVATATVAYFGLYYAFLFSQSYTKVWLVNASMNGGQGGLGFASLKYASPDVAAIKYGGAKAYHRAAMGKLTTGKPVTAAGKSSEAAAAAAKVGTLALVMDRSVGNCLEQQGAFLASTWLHALLVPEGGPEKAARIAWLYVASRAAYPAFFYIGHPWLQLATVPGYVCIWYQLYSLWASG